MPRCLTSCLHAVKACTAIAIVFAIGCGDTTLQDRTDGSPDERDPFTDDAPMEEPLVAKAGLDNPPVAVGPFFNDAFPPRTPNAPGSSTWDVVSAFPALNLGDTLVIEENPSNDRIYVGTRDGLIRSFDNQPDVDTTETFLDLRDRTAVVWDGGFLGLIFHPEFAVPGSAFRNYVYVYYTTHCPLDSSRDQPDLTACFDAYPRNSTGGYFNTYIRLSRFEVPDGSTVADPNSEQVMITFRLYNGSHRGGGMVFRNDGYLHVTIGDQFRYETAQDIVDTLEGGSVRLAVDVTDNGDGTWSCPPGSHLPRRMFDTADEISGQWYCIPDSNPWLDVAGGIFEEYCSIGHRNPHRLAWDPVTDYMWSGEIGQSTREEINVIFCGNNYGWPFREGLTTGVRSQPATFIGTLTDPVIDFVRSEARAIIGGYVYRGSKYPELYGRYLAGDYVTGNIWAITLDESTFTATKEFLTVFDPGGLGTWGEDRDGELYLGDVINGGTLYALDRIGQAVADPPALISQVGAFIDTVNLTPDPSWIPYGLNQPFWSDGAAKSRWIAVPNDGVRDSAGEQIVFSQNGDWDFPIGTVLMKHFELPLDENDPSVTDRLETRFFVHGDDGSWYGLSYRWRADGIDADLLAGGDTSQHTISLSDGSTRDQTWNYPSRLECQTCHRSRGVLGPRTHQLNGDLLYPSTGRTDNQLATWNHLGMFTPAIVEADIPTMIRNKGLGDVTGSLEDRARSWLDSNCAGCHRPGEVQAGFDLRYTTPFTAQGLVWTEVRDDLGTSGTVVVYPGDPERSALFKRVQAIGPIAMPPLAKELPELPAVSLLREWILRVDPSTPQPGIAYEYWESDTQLSVLPAFGTLGTPDEVGTLPAIDLSVRNRDSDFVFRFTAFLQVNTGGDYTFSTISDDGSKLYVDGVEVVDNDGLHGAAEEFSTPIALAPGFYEIVVTMFERGGSEVLSASWSGPDTGGAQAPLAPLFLQIPNPTPNDPPLLPTPADQSTEVGTSATLDLNGSDPDGDLLFFDVVGLPPGLVIDSLTGQISGTVDVDAPTGTSAVTASVSDGPEVAVVTFDWTTTAPVVICGDGVVAPSEECDDGNTTSGDGCSSSCIIESALCGDDVVTPPEQCEPPNTGVCTTSCVTRAPLCGDGFLTPPEQCEDGNTVSGDGCSAICTFEGALQDVTADGSPISFATPAGSGNANPEVFRDGDKPPVGTVDSFRQYDTWNGSGPRALDWVGYTYPDDQTFTQVVFQEGMHFVDGGWFETLSVQVRQNGIWVDVTGLDITPAYPGNNGLSFETFALDFDPTIGDGVRIIGVPGGGANPFISVAELEVFVAVSLTCGNGAFDVGEECDDGNTTSGDGCSGACLAEFCGDGVINNVSETCEPPDTGSCDANCMVRAPVCGDGFVTAPETCEDGNTTNGDGCDSSCQIESVGGEDLTDLGTIIGSVLVPLGGGNPNPEVIRDGDFPPVASADSNRQFDTWDGPAPAAEAWIGYSYPSDQFFGAMVFQEGMQFGDGGWFDSLTVQVRQGGLWSEVSGLVVIPGYGGDNGVNYETFDISFSPTLGDGIRIYGAPGGGADFISVAELEVYSGAAGGPICGDGALDAGEECDDGNNTAGDGCSSTCTAEFCGDNVVNNTDETCEPPNTATCTATCTDRAPLCGDSFITAPETCDDGNTTAGDGCDATCETEIPATCGDGIVTAPETCEPPNTATCTATCTARAPVCGDSFVTAPETCDDGNTTAGDGCDATCQAEAPAVCGDGTITAPETCEPPGTALCNDGCTARTPVCGDSLITPPETCDDGNAIGGDGCSSVCAAEAPGADLTDAGTIIARVLAPLGGGSPSPEVIRDDDRPPVGSVDDARQYDTWDGSNTSADEWIGYSFPTDQVFGKVVFQEGKHFGDGGWFDSLTVQVRQGGGWTEVVGLTTVPGYGGDNGVNYETFELTFSPAVGDAIRIYGAPGGAADFVSVAELDVFAPGVVTCGNGVLDGAEQCDDGNVIVGDGCGATCLNEVCGDGIINNNGAETCDPPGTATCDVDCTARTPLCGDGFLTPPETCEDGNTTSGDGCSASCELEGGNLTSLGTIVAAVPAPLGGGNPDYEVIRDGDFPPVGSSEDGRQYDTWDGGGAATEDWIGYTFAAQYSFSRLVFQEGKEFLDGGWFEPGSLRVQVRQGAIWVDATALTSIPSYGANNGVSYETYELLFDPIVGDGIRIYGAPGGAADFISVGELEAYGSVP